jgi:peptidoglycan/xylan/chitin deacetylase (PgdA/CDA1 family)
MDFISIPMHRVFKAGLLAALVILATPAYAGSCQGTVYLTFDTGTMSQADLIARVLKEEGVKATFFLANEPTSRGDHSLDPSWGAYWKRLADDGHAFGNHTWSHHYRWRDTAPGQVSAVDINGKPVTLDQPQFCQEFKKVESAFQRDAGKALSGIWRAPGGHTTTQTVRWAAGCGYPVHVHWSDAGFIGDELPSETYPNEQLLQRALKHIQSGDVLLLHLGIRSRKTPLAPILKPLIQGLKARGLCFTTLDAGKR